MGLVTDKKKTTKKNKSRAEQEPRSAHGRAVKNNKSRVKQEPRSAHGRAVNNLHLVQKYEDIILSMDIIYLFQEAKLKEKCSLLRTDTGNVQGQN